MLEIDLHDAITDAKLGSGPITSASSYRQTARLSRAGEFSFACAASDPKASLIVKKRVIRAYSVLGDTRTLVGAGVIDDIQRQPLNDGSVTLRVSGSDLLKELTYRSVLRLKLYDAGLPVSHATALSAVAAFAPPGWAMTPDGSPPNATLYGQFNNESVLAAIIKIAEKSNNQFYGGLDRSVAFASAFTPSGVRAIHANGDTYSASLAPETCVITSLTEIENTHDLITRLYPRGSGNADVQTVLRATTRTAPTGYTLNATQNYIEHDATTATYGRIEKAINYREIGPISNSNADIQSAANALFDAALETLKRHSVEMDLPAYRLAVAECSQLLRPMQSIRLVYRDLDAGLDINADVNILEATWSVDGNEVKTTNLVVSHADRWPDSDAGILVDGLESSAIYQALPQLNDNSYTTAYTVHIDDTETGTIEFDLGDEVTQVNQVLLRFRLKPFESTVKSVGGSSGGSGTIPTTGPSTNTSGNPSNDTSGAPSTNISGAPSTNTSDGPSTNTSGVPSIDSSGTANGDTGMALGSTGPNLGNTGSASGDTGPSTGSSGGPSTSDSGTPSNNASGDPSNNISSFPSNNASGQPSLDVSGNPSTNTSGFPSTNIGGGPSIDSTGDPVGGQIEVGGGHRHQVSINAVDPGAGMHAVYVDLNTSPHRFVGGSAMGQIGLVYTTTWGYHTHDMSNHTHSLSDHRHDLGEHWHNLGNHTHNLNNHTHSLNNHTHTLSGHTHSLSGHVHSLLGHTHDLGGHSHSLGGHSHTLNNHTHDLGGHTHNLGNHSHTLSGHTHTLGNHTHTLGSHTHNLGNHTHSLSNHIHDLSESITALYGIFRQTPALTYGIADLEYRVNSGAWINLNTATAISGGRQELDLTSQVVNATTLRQVQDFNTISFRRKAAAVANKTVMIQADLKIRNIIQAISVT